MIRIRFKSAGFTTMNHRILRGIATFPLLVLLGMSAAFADSAGVTFSEGPAFSEQSGEELYTHVCAACHMDEGQGAIGAGRYPALAKNENLVSAGYPIYIVLHGQKGMPPFGGMMSDDQVAAVVNYVRSHFGNDYQDAATAQDVKDSR
jgi:mono/diheme cytochrome c family protein